MDWGAGHYERIAAQLEPAARIVVERAAPRAGQHVLDVGCGTGNAGLLAAESGARVTGVDPSERLLDVARAQATDQRLGASFIRGEAGALPLADGITDVVVSAFGVTFAQDAAAAASEIARVSAPHARVVLSAWVPHGALFEVMRLRGQAVASATAAPTGPMAPTPFAWHDADALSAAFAPRGFSVELREERLAFVGESPEEFLESELREHPVWLAARAVIEPGAELDRLRGRALEILKDANEEPGGFRITSRYAVATLSRT